MAVTTDEGMERRFGEFLGERIGRHLRRREQRESFALYAHGIVADGERKSVEPVAARATGAGDDDDVGVQRQYTGTLGKIGNCQIGVSLTIATRHEHVPIDFALSMPKSWTDDAVRRENSRAADDLVFTMPAPMPASASRCGSSWSGLKASRSPRSLSSQRCLGA